MMIPVFRFNKKKYITGRKGNDSTKNTEIWTPLKYLSNFKKNFEMPLINCEINFILTWSENVILKSGDLIIKYQYLQ